MPSRRAAVVPLLIAGLFLVGPSVGRAEARTISVDAATALVAASWDASVCDVRVHRAKGGVNLVCSEAGSAAIMLRIPIDGVRDERDVRRISVDNSGSSDTCADGTSKPARVRRGAVRLLFVHDGAFDCWYRSVEVRYRLED